MTHLERILQCFSDKPYLLRMGSGSLAKRLHTNPEVIKQAKDLYYKNKSRKPKILLFDLETAPMTAYVWGRWKQNISLSETINEWFIICWSAKWLDDNEIFYGVLTPEEALNQDDCRIVGMLWNLMNQADIICAYNGRDFDIPKMNSRIIVNKYPPLNSYKIIDPYQIVKKQFGFSCNKLDAMARYFGFDVKLDTDFELWARCLKGDQEALDYMVLYNKRDVELLENVFKKILPYAKGVPNLNVYRDSTVMKCPICGCEEVIQTGYYYTNAYRYNEYTCTRCGAKSRSKNCIKEDTKNQLKPIG